MTQCGVLAVIPARYGSTRFPGKPLATIHGVPMILRVYRRAMKVKGVGTVIVATDSEEIKRVVQQEGGICEFTSAKHSSGTLRVAEVAFKRDFDIVLNIQGDEPLFPVRGVEKLIKAMCAEPGMLMATLATQQSDIENFKNPDMVKVVCDIRGQALYFSRSPIPHEGKGFLRHIGIYAYRRSFLLNYDSLKRGPLEESESLEQLRALENGYSIGVIICESKSIGVDRPGDIKRVENILKKD